MNVKSKLAGLEKRMQVSDLERNCPLCRTRPWEFWVSDGDHELPPSQEPPCPLCGKRPKRVVCSFVGSQYSGRPQRL